MRIMTTRASSHSRHQSGGALAVFMLMLPFVVVPTVGLAIDETMLYSVRAKLSSSVDGAAIAAANSLAVGLDLNSQRSSAAKAADQFVRASFPMGYWGAHNLDDSRIDIQEDHTTVYPHRTVEVTASVEVPLTFLRIFGKRFSMVAASGKAARHDVRVVLA
jgi:hypothetical protein